MAETVCTSFRIDIALGSRDSEQRLHLGHANTINGGAKQCAHQCKNTADNNIIPTEMRNFE
ncbi:MAG: hypothetical protein IPP38_08695 [Bacteroidetes bacterium]|nr:hypothetical protein [Bacteroidota bacterium]